MTRQPIAVALCLFVVLAAAACTRTVRINEGPAHATRVGHQDTGIQYNNVVFLDNQLQNMIEVQRSGAQRTPTDTVEVFVVFRNRTTFTQQLECRVQFFDAATVPIGEPSAWQRIYFQPNEIKTWREASLSAAAQYYYVEVREGRRGGP